MLAQHTHTHTHTTVLLLLAQATAKNVVILFYHMLCQFPHHLLLMLVLLQCS